MSSRLRLVRLSVRTARWLLFVVAILLVWAVAIEPRLIDEEWQVATIPDLPREWEGARLALFADLQVGMWLANTDTIRRIVARIVQERPAAVLIAGDFLYEPTQEAGEPREARDELEADDLQELTAQIAEIVELIRPLRTAGIPTFAVLGNHDYAMKWPDSLAVPAAADDLTRALREAGVTMLRNQVAFVGARDVDRPPSDRLHVAGLDAWFPARSDIDLTAAAIPAGAPRVFLMHNPLAFRALPEGTAPVALAAHTHGGQVRFPFLPRWSWMSLVKATPVAADGWIPATFGARGNRLYVNRGIGFSYVPLRLNCRPELTWFTLRRAVPIS